MKVVGDLRYNWIMIENMREISKRLVDTLEQIEALDVKFPGAVQAFFDLVEENNDFIEDADPSSDPEAFCDFFDAANFSVEHDGNDLFMEDPHAEPMRWVVSTKSWCAFEDDEEEAAAIAEELGDD